MLFVFHEGDLVSFAFLVESGGVLTSGKALDLPDCFYDEFLHRVVLSPSLIGSGYRVGGAHAANVGRRRRRSFWGRGGLGGGGGGREGGCCSYS